VEVSHAFATLKPGRVFKKVDSGLRGNIGCELEALIAGLELDLGFIAPAFPEQGRTTRDGVHRLHGVPVAQTEMARDPLTPVRDSRIDRWVGRQTRHPCFHIGLALLDAGESAVIAEVDRYLAAGARLLTFDAVTDVHLDRIAALALQRYPRALLCGSAGLARSLAGVMARARLRMEVRPAPRMHLGGGQFLFVCGSASAILCRQVGELVREAPVALVELSIDTLLARGSAGEREEALRRAAAALGRRSVVIRIAAPGRTAAGVDARALTAALGRFAGALIAACRPGGIFLSGGDTAAAVLEAAGFRSVELAGELSEGVVWGKVQGGTLDGLPAATKAGAFGRPDALLRLFGELNPGAASP
jgi:uncharacterized protein YgbK (DUF1537 family)